MGQLGSENYCGGSDVDLELLWWSFVSCELVWLVRWGMRTAVLGQMGSVNCCVGSDEE
jgi:hypothetical protein